MTEITSSSATQQLTDLRAELIRVGQEIASAEAQIDLYTGGLIKSLLAMRLQVLRTNRALIEQRIHAIESGAPITISLQATNPDESRAAQLEQELCTQSA